MSAFARHGIKHQQPAAAPSRLLFDRRHQGSANATPPRGTVHQHFLDVGAMRLIGRRVEP
jgi:hypothetical protein